LVKANCFFLVYAHNKVQVFNDGIETFEAIFKAVEKAKIFVRLQFNIF
jgi:cardiolipin synthase